MSFDRRITPFRPDLADERLRGRVEAERFSAGRLRRVTAPSAPCAATRPPMRPSTRRRSWENA